MDAKSAEAALIAFAAQFPEAWTDHPWDHTVLKVGQKIFVFFGGAASPAGQLSVTVKLPISCEMALTLPGVRPAGHGLGRAGWVQLMRSDGDDFEIPTLKSWIIQSYKAVAPKRLGKRVDDAPFQ